MFRDLCDEQRVNNWNNTRGCGCYDMNRNNSNLAIQHQVHIVTSDRVKLMPNFSFVKFSLLYLSHMLPVLGWLKRGIINDMGLLEIDCAGSDDTGLPPPVHNTIPSKKDINYVMVMGRKSYVNRV
eukprot:15364524-Ditylum_brightwellii.AAC.1